VSDLVAPVPTEHARQLAVQAWCTPETSAIEMDVRLADAFAAILDKVTDELERTRVQLAGCGVAAMGNTRETLARNKEVKQGDYGWSASYGDCLRAAEREIELREAATALSSAPISTEALARKFHETYERLAPQFGYETRAETRKFSPLSTNGMLMIAVCAEIQRTLSSAQDLPNETDVQAGIETLRSYRKEMMPDHAIVGAILVEYSRKHSAQDLSALRELAASLCATGGDGDDAHAFRTAGAELTAALTTIEREKGK